MNKNNIYTLILIASIATSSYPSESLEHKPLTALMIIQTIAFLNGLDSSTTLKSPSKTNKRLKPTHNKSNKNQQRHRLKTHRGARKR